MKEFGVSVTIDKPLFSSKLAPISLTKEYKFFPLLEQSKVPMVKAIIIRGFQKFISKILQFVRILFQLKSIVGKFNFAPSFEIPFYCLKSVSKAEHKGAIGSHLPLFFNDILNICIMISIGLKSKGGPLNGSISNRRL